MKIGKCVECGGLLMTGFVYPDDRVRHGDCWEKVREAVEKEVNDRWLVDFNRRIEEEKSARESAI